VPSIPQFSRHGGIRGPVSPISWHEQDIDQLVDSQTLRAIRQEIIDMALEQVFNNREILLTLLRASPRYRDLIHSSVGYSTSLLITHPQFMNPTIFRELMSQRATSDASSESDSLPDLEPEAHAILRESVATRTVGRPRASAALRESGRIASRVESVGRTDVSLTPEETEQIDFICSVLPNKQRELIIRTYNECGKNQEHTINILLEQ
jgi:hypothetical protein